jgi:hypothetical protein
MEAKKGEKITFLKLLRIFFNILKAFSDKSPGRLGY